MTDMQELAPGVHQQGLYASLEINATTRPVKAFFDRLPPGYGSPVDPKGAHLTLVEPEESTVDVWGERDLIALRNAEHAIARHLGHLPLNKFALEPEGEELEKLRGHLVVPVVKTSFLEDLRGTISDIVEKEAGVKIEVIKNWIPHMSATHLGRGNKKPNIRANRPPFPSRLTVSGFRTGQSVVANRASRSKQAYTQKPRSQR
jgi:hypothetical protein